MSKRPRISIFTTASLPWMTGTAVNPLFRAAYLSKNNDRDVTLVIPWLSLKDQELVYPNNIVFDTPKEHEAYVRRWLEERTGFKSGFGICFYPGKFSLVMRSIFPIGDITSSIADDEAEIAILEEPEHLTWYHHGRKWKSKFQRVIGIVHTNYLEYVKREKNGYLIALVMKYTNKWVTRIYCHKVIRLSAATQVLPRSVVCNVHGVNPKFLEVGKVRLGQQEKGELAFAQSAYYIGKMVWSKGYRELLQLLREHEDKLSGVKVDMYGSGEDQDQVKEYAGKLKVDITVYPGRDHADPVFHDYKVFLNPSTTDVLCTTTAEALAMGKIVICADHPSNEFFKQFPNCRVFKGSANFIELTLKALAEEPSPLSDDQRHILSWEAATERLVTVAELNGIDSAKAAPSDSKTVNKRKKRSLEGASASIHQTVSGIEFARRAFGAIPRSLQPDEELCKELGLVYPKGPKQKQSLKQMSKT